ncbi:hypothetical protein C8R44DRAFT_26396 [Mycena epipterygia]|nr:hypothetical protein C8R44DRAFT_26396 [Mycena epipterygia]
MPCTSAPPCPVPTHRISAPRLRARTTTRTAATTRRPGRIRTMLMEGTRVKADMRQRRRHRLRARGRLRGRWVYLFILFYRLSFLYYHRPSLRDNMTTTFPLLPPSSLPHPRSAVLVHCLLSPFSSSRLLCCPSRIDVVLLPTRVPVPCPTSPCVPPAFPDHRSPPSLVIIPPQRRFYPLVLLVPSLSSMRCRSSVLPLSRPSLPFSSYSFLPRLHHAGTAENCLPARCFRRGPRGHARQPYFLRLQGALHRAPRRASWHLTSTSFIDADTMLAPDSLNRLVTSAADDSIIIGICGEMKLQNEEGRGNDDWTFSVASLFMKRPSALL